MKFQRYVAFGGTVQVSLSVSERGGVDALLNLPHVGRFIARGTVPPPTWLRGKSRAEVSGAVFAPSYGCAIWSAVTRCGFFDRGVGDVPIAWEWYSDGRNVTRRKNNNG